MDKNIDLKENSKNDEENITLSQIFSIFLRRSKLFGMVTLFFFSGSVFFTIYQRTTNPIFRGTFAIMTSDPIGSEAFVGESTVALQTLTNGGSNVDLATLRVFLKSPVVLKPLADEMNLTTEFLEDIITITDESRSRSSGNVVNVSINLKDYKLGKKIISKLSETYMKLAVDMRQKRLNDGLDFLNSQVPSISKERDEIKSKLSDYRKKYTFIDPRADGLGIQQTILEYKGYIKEINRNLDNLKEIKNDVESRRLTSVQFVEKFGVDAQQYGVEIKNANFPIIEEALALEQKLERQKGTFREDSFVVQNIQNYLNSIRPSVINAQLEALEAASKFYKDKLSSYELAINNYKNDFVMQPDIIKGFEDFERKIEFNDEMFKSLTRAREVFRLEIAQKTAPWTIISPPKMYSKPTGPNILKYLVYGVFISISLGSLITYLRDRLDNVYHNASTVISDIGSISLGLIPYISFFEGIREQKKFILKNLDKQIEDNKLNNEDESLTTNNEEKINSYQRFFYQEAFRNILTSIRFLESDKEINVVTITSSIPAEGKTLVNILLAKTYSELDKKVLLIDGDLRKPQLHYRLGINNILGLSNILTDSSLDVSKVIKKVEGYENWDVITSGFIPPDPARLLSSDRMTEFINTLRNSRKYDIVIFDCPPVIGLADASLIAEKTDGMILLVSLDRVPVGLPLEAKRIMKNSGAEFLGIIINSMKENKNPLTNKTDAYGYSDIYAQYAEEESISEELTSKQILLNKLKEFFKKSIKWLDD